MPTFFCRRHQDGIATDELEFVAANTADAEAQAWRFLRMAAASHVNWARDFATLEDANGAVITTWTGGAGLCLTLAPTGGTGRDS